MPFISTKTSKTLTVEQKTALKERFGKAIELIPGKSERWLMLGFEDGITMSFAGNMTEPAAMVEVDIFGSTTKAAYDSLTKELCAIVEDITAIPASRIYIKYREVDTWGWNGQNF